MRKFRFPLVMTLILAALWMAACSAAPAETPQTAPVETSGPASTPQAEPTPTVEAAAQTLSLTDGLGRTIDLAGPAQRIVSLAPSNTEILFAIGAGDQVVGRDLFSDYPQSAAEVTDIGGDFGELNTELIVSLEPDLLLGSELTPQEQVQALEDLGLTVFVLPNPKEIEEMYENLRTTGQLTGHLEEAEALIAELQSRVQAVDVKIAGAQERPLVFYELDSTEPDSPWTAGSGTFIARLIDRAGGENLGDMLEGEWAQISIEALLVEDPDIILLGDYTWGGVTPEDVQARPSWQGLSAVENGRIYPFDDNLVSRPGPRLVDGLEEMARLLHPELFE